MKHPKTAVLLLLVFLVALISVPQIETVKAQDPLNITIKPDGSVVPETDLLERSGNTYTFTDDIFGTIMVQKSGITIDGSGYTIQGQKIVDQRGIYLVGPDRSHASCRDVIVKNLRIYNYFEGIYLVGGSNNSIVDNHLENTGIHLIGNANYEADIIMHNIFQNANIFVDYNPDGLDVVTENNFFNGSIGVGLSVSPIVEKNYWSDYNGTDNDGDGIGDTPHTSQYPLDEEVQDNYPLMDPLDLAVIPEFLSWTFLIMGLVVATVLSTCYRRRFKQGKKDEVS